MNRIRSFLKQKQMDINELLWPDRSLPKHTKFRSNSGCTVSNIHLSPENQTEISVTAPAAQSIHGRSSQVKPCHCRKQRVRITTKRLEERLSVFITHLRRHAVFLAAAELGPSPSAPDRKPAAGMLQRAPPSDRSTEATNTSTMIKLRCMCTNQWSNC